MPDQIAVELIIDDQKATVKLDNFGQKIKSVSDDINKVGGDTKFAGKLTTDFDALSKRVEETRRQFQEVAKVRLDGGSVGNLTREIITAQTHSRQLAADIVNIRKELANPNRTSSITFLAATLRAAEAEADRLNRKLNSLPGAAQGGIGRGGANNLRLSGFQKTNLSYQVNDVLTGLASGQNPGQILAQQGGQIAQIFSKEQIVGFTAAYGGLVSILGLGTLAIAATYKITGDIRAEAERRLKAEEMITGAINKQRIAQREAFADLQKERIAADRSQNFSQFLKTDDVEALKRRRDYLLHLVTPNAYNVSLEPATLPSVENGKIVQKASERFQTLKRELLDIDARIKQVPIERNAQSLNLFEQNNENFKKNQENNLEFERKRNEEIVRAQKKRNEDIEKGKAKVKELEKQYLSTFDNLFQKANSNNPFVSIFTDADKALKDLKQNIKGLPPELQKIAVETQKKINFRQLLSANLDNQLSTFDLRTDANNFRNPFDGEKQKKDQQEFVERFLRNNPNYLFSNNKSALDDETRSKILKQFAPSALNETPADRFNKTLDDKFNLLYKPGQTAEQLALADRKFISLTNGANPLDLSKNLRESAALVREREAIREERYQQDALNLYREQRDYQKQIAQNTAAQNKLAEKGGANALKLIVQDETKDGLSYEYLPDRPQGGATVEKPAYQFGGFGVGGKNGSNR